jgi:hypothetical protein
VTLVLPVLKSDLRNLELIKDGNFGTVYKTAFKLSTDPATELAYKEFMIPAPGGGNAKPGAGAEKAAQFRDRYRFRPDLADLDRYFAWPRGVVRDDATGEICGFLMPLARPEFYWQQGRLAGKPRMLDWLISTEQNWQKAGVDLSQVTETDRFFLMLQLVYAVAWLHNQGWVFGDLSFTNAAFGLNPPMLMLFDCDEAVELADPGREPQPHSPNWYPPECVGSQPHPQDAKTDVYKLGLAIVRCMKPGKGAGTTADVKRLTGILDTEGIDLLTRVLSADRTERPPARELFLYLKGLIDPRMVPPQIIDAELITPLVPRRSEARIRWQIEKADDVQVLLGEGSPHPVTTVRLADHPSGCVFPALRCGTVTVQAINNYGTATQVIGDLARFKVPSFNANPGNLPRPNIPSFPDFNLGPFPAPPPGYPAPPRSPDVPRFEFADLLRGLAPSTVITSAWVRFMTALHGSRSRMSRILDDTKRYIVRLWRRNVRDGND